MFLVLPVLHGCAGQEDRLAPECGDLPAIISLTPDSPSASRILHGRSDLASGDDGSRVSCTPDISGTYVLSVVVSDLAGDVSEPGYVTFTVVSGNAPPIADCGGDIDAAPSSWRSR